MILYILRKYLRSDSMDKKIVMRAGIVISIFVLIILASVGCTYLTRDKTVTPGITPTRTILLTRPLTLPILQLKWLMLWLLSQETHQIHQDTSDGCQTPDPRH